MNNRILTLGTVTQNESNWRRKQIRNWERSMVLLDS